MIAGISGGEWGASTINGNRQRGTGILNNELYIGQMVWNRLRYMKNPETGKRVSRLNPENEWIRKDVPDLRIVPEALWNKVKERQGGLRKNKAAFWEMQRPKNLFSYLLKCGCCGSGFSKISQNHYGCSRARNKGTCDNRLTIRQDVLEGSILNALKHHLMDDALCKIFCEEYTRHLNQLRFDHNANLKQYEAELKKRRTEDSKMVQAIIDGFASEDLKVKMNKNTERIVELKRLLEEKQEAKVLFHPTMSVHYKKELESLASLLNHPEHRQEAADSIRSLIDKIILTPNVKNDELIVDLVGDLAGILKIATNKTEGDERVKEALKMTKSQRMAGSETLVDVLQDKVVAGTRIAQYLLVQAA